VVFLFSSKEQEDLFFFLLFLTPPFLLFFAKILDKETKQKESEYKKDKKKEVSSTKHKDKYVLILVMTSPCFPLPSCNLSKLSNGKRIVGFHFKSQKDTTPSCYLNVFDYCGNSTQTKQDVGRDTLFRC